MTSLQKCCFTNGFPFHLRFSDGNYIFRPEGPKKLKYQLLFKDDNCIQALDLRFNLDVLRRSKLFLLTGVVNADL